MKSKFDIKYFELENLNKNSIEDIRNNRIIDGFVIRDFLNSEEVNLTTKYATDNINEFFILKEGMKTWPLPLGNYSVNDDFFSYYDNVNSKWENDNFFLKEKLFNLFEKLNFNCKFLEKQNKKITYGSFRNLYLEKEIPTLNIHVGNAFYRRFYAFFKKFDKNILFENQLSYFILLKKPKSGGMLELFNVEWNECKEVVMKSSFFKSNKDELIYYKDVYSEIIEMNEGDLLVFAGGEIYHQVTSHFGGERLTFGGFLSFDKRNNKTIYIWT